MAYGSRDALINGTVSTPHVTIPEGYNLGNLFINKIVPIAEQSESAYWRKFPVPMREHLQLASPVFGVNANRTFNVQVTGAPFARFFFRARGVAELVGWGEGAYESDRTKVLEEHFGNIYTLNSSVFTLRRSGIQWRQKYEDGTTTEFTFNPGMAINRTVEPAGYHIPGAYYLDRIIAISGKITESQFTASFGLFTSLALQTSTAANGLSVGGGPAGDYPQVRDYGPTLGLLFNPQSTNGGTWMWGNPKSTNPQSLKPDAGLMITADGFPYPGGRYAIQNTNVMELVFLGCRAEKEIRDEEIIDVRTPELLNEF